LGLGLTLAKQAIEQFGGSLSLDSALNAGTTATITLKPAT
jgi:signal transduction histidine kinase